MGRYLIDELNDVYGTLAALKAELDRIPDKPITGVTMDDLGGLLAYWTYAAELIADILENDDIVPPGKLPVLHGVIESASAAMIHEINRIAGMKPMK